jgi:uncharacterized protein YecE (DUF72 family)
MQQRDYLSFYAEHFDSVEVDSTFYACPSANAVSAWFSKTPASFIFSVKVPQICCGVSYVAQSVAGPFSPALDVI